MRRYGQSGCDTPKIRVGFGAARRGAAGPPGRPAAVLSARIHPHCAHTPNERLANFKLRDERRRGDRWTAPAVRGPSTEDLHFSDGGKSGNGGVGGAAATEAALSFGTGNRVLRWVYARRYPP